MNTTGGADPADLRNLPEPADLHSALARRHPLNWGERLPTKAQLVDAFGAEAARLTLLALRARVAAEPAATEEFVAALSDESSSYKLESRVKSPQSLARKYADRLETLDDEEPDDILRYTMITESPDHLVAETQLTIDRLHEAGWRPVSAVHSYTEGSRYKRDPHRLPAADRRDRRGAVSLGRLHQGEGGHHCAVRDRAERRRESGRARGRTGALHQTVRLTGTSGRHRSTANCRWRAGQGHDLR